MDEILEIYSESMRNMGVKKRSSVHKDGDLHQVVHCWGYRKENGKIWLYFQQRSFNKKDYPGLYDLLATGHIDVGEDITSAMIREMNEETGILADEDNLIYMGRVRQSTYNDKISDNEMTNVFIYELADERFNINNEVERIVKMRFSDYYSMMTGRIVYAKAYTLNGDVFKIGKNEWCDKTGEFKAFIENSDIFLSDIDI